MRNEDVMDNSANNKRLPYGSSDGISYFKNLDIADDVEYAFNPQKPVKVYNGINGIGDSKKYLNSLMGPNNEVIHYERLRSVIGEVDNANDEDCIILDEYIITFQGASEPKVVYLDIYRSGQLLVPFGLTPRQ